MSTMFVDNALFSVYYTQFCLLLPSVVGAVEVATGFYVAQAQGARQR